jgi:hypothetical protein
MEQQGATEEKLESARHQADEQRAREREALRLRVRESLLRCPGADGSADA